MRNYNAARASAFFRSIMTQPMLMDPRVIMERAHFAAAMGNREAQMFLRMTGPSARSSRAAVAPAAPAPRERDPFLRKLLRK